MSGQASNSVASGRTAPLAVSISDSVGRITCAAERALRMTAMEAPSGANSGASVFVTGSAPSRRLAPESTSISRIDVSSSRSAPGVCQVTATCLPSRATSNAGSIDSSRRACGVRSRRAVPSDA
jgi:hypothetical protein